MRQQSQRLPAVAAVPAAHPQKRAAVAAKRSDPTGLVPVVNEVVFGNFFVGKSVNENGQRVGN